MSFRVDMAVTTYIVVSGGEDSRVSSAKKRLVGAASILQPGGRQRRINDPYILHSLIAQESYLQSRIGIINCGWDLTIDEERLHEYSMDVPLDGRGLRSLMDLLHYTSQDADHYLQRSGTETMVVEQMCVAHRHLGNLTGVISRQGSAHIEDLLGHLLQSWEARKRRLLGIVSRKEIAMNLVSTQVNRHDSIDRADGLRPRKGP